jgi:hypothetical protein
MPEPLIFEPVEVVLEGLSQKDDKKATTPGRLRSALNVEFDKTHALNKRRGFERVDIGTDTKGFSTELAFVSVATYRQELVVYGRHDLYAVLAIDADVSDASVVRRGPTLCGNYRTHHVFSSAITEGAIVRAD